MLNTHQNGLSETQILERIKAARAEPESEQEQPESEEPVTLQEEVVEETVEAESEEEVVYEEEDQHEEQSTEASEEEEGSVYLIGDEEITLSELKELKSGSLRQSDYTKKTTELSEQRKALEGKALATDKLHNELSENIKALSDSINSEVESVDWEELADTDPSEFLKKQRAIEKKTKILKDAKENESVLLQQKATEEVGLLVSKMPSWSGEDGEKNRKKDSDLAVKWMQDAGITDAESAQWVNHKLYLAFIKAAKYDALKSKAPSIKKKVANAPKVTPTTKAAKRKISKSEEAKTRLKRTGSEADALAAIKSLYKG